jgi:hypothetical protein
MNRKMSDTYIRNPDLVAAEMDGDLVMMSIESGEYFGLGGVGSRIWSLMEQPTTEPEIVKALCADYDVDETTCSKNVRDFIDELLKWKLISIVT